MLEKVTRPHGVSFISFLHDIKGDMTRDEMFQFLAADALATGWGRVFIEEDDDEIRVIAPKGFPLGQQFVLEEDKTESPVDYYFMGYFEGALSRIDGIPYKGKETECVAKGCDRCVFVFRK